MECKSCCGSGGRPNRSDVHLSREQEAEIEAETRDYFNEVIPKRHTKPQRSEYSSKYVDLLSPHDANQQQPNNNIPEFVEFQRLENHPQVIDCYFFFSIYIFLFSDIACKERTPL